MRSRVLVQVLFLTIALASPASAGFFEDLLNSQSGQQSSDDPYYQDRDRVRESADVAYQRQQSAVRSQQALQDLRRRREEASAAGQDTSALDGEIQHTEQAYRDDLRNFENADRGFRQQRRQFRQNQDFYDQQRYNNSNGYNNGYNRNYQRRSQRFNRFNEDSLEDSDRYDRWR